ncbi:hypothetical protein BHF01_22950 [Escherichia coli]|nr:hypothetical protein BHF01_22950 [Escherichia coli]
MEVACTDGNHAQCQIAIQGLRFRAVLELLMILCIAPKSTKLIFNNQLAIIKSPEFELLR